MKSNFEQMHTALGQSSTGAEEFLQLWAEQLSEDRIAQLTDWVTKGVRVGLHLVMGGPAPLFEITARDAAGNLHVLERLDFEKKQCAIIAPRQGAAGCSARLLHKQRGMPAGVEQAPAMAACVRFRKGLPMTLRHSLPLLELRAQPEGLVEGYASVFGGIDSYGDTVQPGAFAESLAKHNAARTMPPMLWSHAAAKPVGRWEGLREDSRGLQVEGRLNLRTAAGAEAYEHLRAGDINGLSIGYIVAPGGSELKGGVNLLKRIDLQEVSLVALPADSNARITSVKAAAERPVTLRQFEDALRQMGFTRREAARIATKGFGDFQPDTGIPDEDMHAAHAALSSLINSLKGST